MPTIREINQLRILNLLRLNPGISRAEMVRRTGLGKATISTLVSDFIEEGVISEGETGVQTAGAGRRPIELVLNGGVRCAVGIELTGSELIAALVDLCGNPLELYRMPTEDHCVDKTVDRIEHTVRHLVKGCLPEQVLGVGIGVPGPVARGQSVVTQAVNLGWVSVPLGALVEERVGLPATVVKRQNAGALGEYWYGAGKGKDAILFVSSGIGIGSGMVVDGKLFQGVAGHAGEIGHMTIVPDGHRCYCGNYGCLETVASTLAIALRTREKIREGRESELMQRTNGLLDTIDAEMVFDAAEAGDPLAREVVEEAAQYLGIAIANAVNLMNPSMVVLGGEILTRGDLFLRPIRETIFRRACTPSAIGVDIVPSSLGVKASAIGAAMLVIDGFFKAVDLEVPPETLGLPAVG